MTGRVRTPALVLRTRALQDHDLIVDLLGLHAGRVSVVAKGARKTPRRYGGALEMGTRVDLEVAFRPGRDLHTLTRCEVVTPIRRIREDFDRITALAYVLELVRLCAREGAQDPRLYGLATGIVDVLETAAPTAEGVMLWEVALLAHQGYAMTPTSVAREANLSAEAHASLERLWRGDTTAFLDGPTAEQVRHGLERVWQRTVGYAPRSGRFLNLAADAAC